MEHISNDLFLLMADLSKIKTKASLIQVFVKRVNTIFPDCGLVWYSKEENVPSPNIKVCTRTQTYGFILHNNNLSKGGESHLLVEQAVQLLNVFIEKLEQEELLAGKKGYHQQMIDKKTKQLIQKQDELIEKNEEYAALNEEYQVLNEELNEGNRNLHQLNKQLARQESIYHSLAENSPDYIMRYGRDLRHLYINEAGLKFSGASREQVIGKTFCESGLYTPELCDYWEEKINKVFESGQPWHEHFKWENVNGLIWLDCYINPEYDTNGNITSVLSVSRDITSLKKTENELKESRELHQTFINSTDDIVFLKDSQLRYVIVNEAQKDFFGKPENEILGNTDFELMPPEAVRNCLLSDTMVLESRQATINIEQVGDRIYETRKFPVKLSNEETGVGAFIRDITQQKAAEDALHENRKNFRDLFNNAPVGYHEIDTKGNIISVNNTELQMLGYTKEEMIGKPVWIFAEDKESSRKSVLKKLSGKQMRTEVHERYYQRKDGSKIPVLIDEKYILDNTGKVTKIRTTLQNITDLKKAEEEITKLSRAVEQSPVSIIITDLNGLIEYVNPKVTELTGYTKEELIGKNPHIFSSKEKAKEEYKILWDTIKAGKEWHGEFHNKKKNGELYWESASISPILNEKGEIAHYLGIREDITERKKLTLDLIASKEKAEECDRLKTAFLANISHEIRTPMNGIIGFAELLKYPDLSGERQLEFIQIIEKSGQRMLNIINDIVDISKIEAGQMMLHLEETDINQLLKDLFLFFTPEAKTRGLNFIYSCGLPDEECIINTDHTKLTQILTNLIKNAFKFTESGVINFGYNLKGQKLQFYVKDTGEGIAPEQMEIIFERFRQGDISNSRQYEGTGLGLPISKAYVEMLGGKIWIESELGKGTAFYFNIPYNLITNKQNGNQEDPSLTKSLQTVNILIAEDDEMSMKYLKEVLENNTVNLFFAENGQEAVDLVRDNPKIDIVIIDLKMPLMDGFEATRQIKQIRPDLPIIAQTAFAFSDDEKRIKQAGCDEYIAKPLNSEILFEKINKLLVDK